MSEVVARLKTPSRPPPGIDVYELACRLATEVDLVVQRITEGPRSFLRDQLARKSATVPPLIRQAMECESQVERRAVYGHACRVTQDCAAMLDDLGRGAPTVVEAARGTARALIEALGPLATPPR